MRACAHRGGGVRITFCHYRYVRAFGKNIHKTGRTVICFNVFVASERVCKFIDNLSSTPVR